MRTPSLTNMFADVARYRMASAESGETWKPELVVRGVLRVESDVLRHESDDEPWEWPVTRDACLRWAHESQWSGDGQGLIVATFAAYERTLLVFESLRSRSDDSDDKARAALAAEIGLSIGCSWPDPPMCVAGFSGAILRSSCSCRDSMLMCGVRKGKAIKERGDTSRKQRPAVKEPKEVNASMLSAVKGTRQCSGACAGGLTCVTDTIQACAAAVGAGGHSVARGPLRPVFDSTPVLSITTLLGATLGSMFNLVGGAFGGVGATCAACGTSCIEDVRHDYGDDMADLSADSIAVGTNVASAAHSITKTATFSGVATQAVVGVQQGAIAAESGAAYNAKGLSSTSDAAARLSSSAVPAAAT